MAHQNTKQPVSEEEFRDLMSCRGSSASVPVLKHKAENRVKSTLKDVALRGCDDKVRAFAQCAQGRLISVVWHCRAFSKAVDECMHSFAGDELLKEELRRRHAAKFPGAVKSYVQSSNVGEAGEAPV